MVLFDTQQIVADGFYNENHLYILKKCLRKYCIRCIFKVSNKFCGTKSKYTHDVMIVNQEFAIGGKRAVKPPSVARSACSEAIWCKNEM